MIRYANGKGNVIHIIFVRDFGSELIIVISNCKLQSHKDLLPPAAAVASISLPYATNSNQ